MARLALILAGALVIRVLYTLLVAQDIPVIGDALTYHLLGGQHRRRQGLRARPASAAGALRGLEAGGADRRAPAAVSAADRPDHEARCHRLPGAEAAPVRGRDRDRRVRGPCGPRGGRAHHGPRGGGAGGGLSVPVGGGRLADERDALRRSARRHALARAAVRAPAVARPRGRPGGAGGPGGAHARRGAPARSAAPGAARGAGRGGVALAPHARRGGARARSRWCSRRGRSAT